MDTSRSDAVDQWLALMVKSNERRGPASLKHEPENVQGCACRFHVTDLYSPRGHSHSLGQPKRATVESSWCKGLSRMTVNVQVRAQCSTIGGV